MYLYKGTHVCQKLQHQAYGLPVRIEVVFEGKLPANHSFKGGDWLCFLQLGLFRQVEVKHVSLERNPSVVEAGASRTFFTFENQVKF
jgi:hypothetical protein